jgi:hypothetical protein
MQPPRHIYASAVTRRQRRWGRPRRRDLPWLPVSALAAIVALAGVGAELLRGA